MNIMVVAGYRKVHFLVKKFISEGHKLTIIHRDEEECKKLAKIHKASIVHGDGTDPAILEDAGVMDNDVLVAISSNDAENFVACQIAGRVYGVDRTLAFVNEPEYIDVFKRLGVSTVISTADIIYNMIDQKISVEEIINLMPMEDGKIGIMDIEIADDFKSEGKSLAEISLPEDSVIAFIIRGERQMVPRGSTVVKEGDRLIILSLSSVQTAVIEAIKGRVD